MARQNDTRPKSKPTPVRFTEELLREIDAVAEALAMSRQDVIRLSVAAGLKALKSLGHDGLIRRIAEEIAPEAELIKVAEQPAKYNVVRRPSPSPSHDSE